MENARASWVQNSYENKNKIHPNNKKQVSDPPLRCAVLAAEQEEYG